MTEWRRFLSSLFLMSRFVRGLISNIHLVGLHMSSPKFLSPVTSQIEMLGHASVVGGKGSCEHDGKGGMDWDGSLCSQRRGESIEPLLLLIQATQVNGQPLPIGSFTAWVVVAMVQRHTGNHPVDVDVMSDWDAVIELEPNVRVGEVAQLLHGTHEWDGQPVEISCSLSTRHSIINVVQECKNGHAHLQQLEDEQHRVREEQQQHQEQLAKFLVQFQEEMRKIEKLQQNQTNDDQMTLRAVGVEEPKSFKPPTLPPFSGADPIPKDKASCEQWVWQAKEALKSCTAGAVRIVIAQSVRGEVREFAAAVGFKASVEVLLEKREDRFGESGQQMVFSKISTRSCRARTKR